MITAVFLKYHESSDLYFLFGILISHERISAGVCLNVDNSTLRLPYQTTCEGRTLGLLYRCRLGRIITSMYGMKLQVVVVSDDV